MNPSWLSDDQVQLRDTLHRLLANGPVPAARLAEIGALGATLPEAYGGLGFGLIEATIIAESLGRARSTVPFVEATVVAGGLIARLGSDSQRARWLPGIADGTLRVAIAFAERLHLDPRAPFFRSRKCPGGYELEGTKAPVVGAPGADLILINARGEGGVSLHAIPAADLPLSAEYRMVDGLAAATIEASGHKVSADSLLGPEGTASSVLEEVLEQNK